MSTQGTVYLIHFKTPYRHAAHYCGWALRLIDRLEEHRRGTGGRLMAVVRERGIDWVLACTWTGDRHLERRIKKTGGLARCCPICNPQPTRRFPDAADATWPTYDSADPPPLSSSTSATWADAA